MRFLTFMLPLSWAVISCNTQADKKTDIADKSVVHPATLAVHAPVAAPAEVHKELKFASITPASLNLLGKWTVLKYYLPAGMDEAKAKAYIGKTALTISADKVVHHFNATSDTCMYAGAGKLDDSLDAFLEGAKVSIPDAPAKVTIAALQNSNGLECVSFVLLNKNLLIWADGYLYELQKSN